MKLTPEQVAYLKKLADPHYYGEQDENGVDLSLIRRNLAMTVEDRIAQSSRARRSALRLLEIGWRNREIKLHINRAKDQESIVQLKAIVRVLDERP